MHKYFFQKKSVVMQTKQGQLVQLLPSFDIVAWTEEDVYCWMQQLVRRGDTSGEMSVYANLFKEHHITGKRLLVLEEDDLKDMGIVSKGHIIHLKTAIEKLAQDFLTMFHFPPLTKDSASENEASEEKVVNLELVFGYHLKPGTGPQVGLNSLQFYYSESPQVDTGVLVKGSLYDHSMCLAHRPRHLTNPPVEKQRCLRSY
ncbi:UNVERIFIED_CONTAM: hypothetical protein K2H54_042525 [Gekko kuhli]